jgi:HK97 family phage prohead protease
MEPDFSGYATKAGLQCSDGRTIMPGAFKHQDKAKVPLVWQHGHSDPENVLGHAILENRDDGVYAYGYFNNSVKASHAKNLIEHGDITMLSIWANQLVERASKVLHGAIREVSLVLSGANPGALIENVTIRHSDGEDMTLEDEAIIYTGLELEHSEVMETEDVTHEDTTLEDVADVTHATTEDPPNPDETIQDIYDSMTDKQKEVLHFMLGQALESVNADTAQTDMMQQDNVSEETETHENQKGTEEMKHNVFEKKDETYSLTHSDIQGIIADATKGGSLRDAVESYALAHGIEDIDTLFPDAVALDKVPEFLKRRTEWVSKVLGNTRKSPFSRIKTLSADITVEEARAKGYIKGALKKEEFFGVAKRVTTPTTVYKKQKLDRDDVIDITDFDVVVWLKGEMRLMLDEEIARAILIGDGRDVAHEDKINEGNIRPIAKDHELYATTLYVNLGDASSSISELIDAIILNRASFKGSGLPTLFTTETIIAQFLLLKDTLGRRIYKTLDEIANELRVAEIVPVEVMEEDPDVVAIMVNMMDYIVGATAGGPITMFDDFDIDYNQYKYLIETRMCGALTKLKSAIVVKKTAGTAVLVSPNMPTFNEDTGVLSIVNQTGVVYKNGDTVVNAAGSPYAAIPAGTSITIDATPAAGYYFATSDNDSWTFTRNA